MLVNGEDETKKFAQQIQVVVNVDEFTRTQEIFPCEYPNISNVLSSGVQQ